MRSRTLATISLQICPVVGMNNDDQGPVGAGRRAEQLLAICGVRSAAQPPSAAAAAGR